MKLKTAGHAAIFAFALHSAPALAQEPIPPPTQAEVGDADSFGRPVIYLGLAEAPTVAILPDCSTANPQIARCVVAQPAPLTTSFNEADLATISLPARASRSLLCFGYTPFIFVNWANRTGAAQLASFQMGAKVTIESSVFADPALIDPGTGLPMNGAIVLTMQSFGRTHTLQNGEVEQQRTSESRVCAAGFITRTKLMENYGLSREQAHQVFRRPMTLRFGAVGSVAMTESAQFFYHLRLYGD
jgi:hypothetical protein